MPGPGLCFISHGGLYIDIHYSWAAYRLFVAWRFVCFITPCLKTDVWSFCQLRGKLSSLQACRSLDVACCNTKLKRKRIRAEYATPRVLNRVPPT